MAYLHSDRVHFVLPHSRVRWGRVGVTAALALFWLTVAALIIR